MGVEVGEEEEEGDGGEEGGRGGGKGGDPERQILGLACWASVDGLFL